MWEIHWPDTTIVSDLSTSRENLDMAGYMFWHEIPERKVKHEVNLKQQSHFS